MFERAERPSAVSAAAKCLHTAAVRIVPDFQQHGEVLRLKRPAVHAYNITGAKRDGQIQMLSVFGIPPGFRQKQIWFPCFFKLFKKARAVFEKIISVAVDVGGFPTRRVC